MCLGALTLMANVINDNEAPFGFMLPVRLAMASLLRGAPTVPNGPIYTAPGGIPVVSQWGNLRYAAAQAAISLQLARQYNTLNEVESNIAYACFTQQVLRQALGECCVRKSGGVGAYTYMGKEGSRPGQDWCQSTRDLPFIVGCVQDAPCLLKPSDAADVRTRVGFVEFGFVTNTESDIK